MSVISIKFDTNMLNGSMKNIKLTMLNFLYILILLSLSSTNSVKAGSKGDDIILTKGKLIVRGGKGSGK